MRLGAFLPPWGAAALPDDYDRVAEAVEACGYDSLWTGDHVLIPPSVRSRYPYNASGVSPFDPAAPHSEPLTLLAYLAARTRRARLGLSVLVLPLRHPLLAARMLAGVQSLSRGRLVLGVGVGWMKEEFQLLDADFERRAEVSERYLEVIRAQLGSGVPVLVGGQSSAALRRAARLGDGWHGIRLSPEEVAAPRARLAELRGGLEGFEIVVRAPVRSREEVEAYAAAGVTELIVEVPDATTAERVGVLEKLGGPA